MKQADILKVLHFEFGTSDLVGVNRALKAKNYSTKFRITGPAFVHYGFTGLIKAITADGVKVYNVNKVTLVKFEDIATFAKAKAREERQPKEEKKQSPLPKPQKLKQVDLLEDDEDYDNDDDFDEELDAEDDIIEDDSVAMKILKPQKKKPKRDALNVPGSGSQFIPKKK